MQGRVGWHRQVQQRHDDGEQQQHAQHRAPADLAE